MSLSLPDCRITTGLRVLTLQAGRHRLPPTEDERWPIPLRAPSALSLWGRMVALHTLELYGIALPTDVDKILTAPPTLTTLLLSHCDSRSYLPFISACTLLRHLILINQSDTAPIVTHSLAALSTALDSLETLDLTYSNFDPIDWADLPLALRNIGSFIHSFPSLQELRLRINLQFATPTPNPSVQDLVLRHILQRLPTGLTKLSVGTGGRLRLRAEDGMELPRADHLVSWLEGLGVGDEEGRGRAGSALETLGIGFETLHTGHSRGVLQELGEVCEARGLRLTMEGSEWEDAVKGFEQAERDVDEILARAGISSDVEEEDQPVVV